MDQQASARSDNRPSRGAGLSRALAPPAARLSVGVTGHRLERLGQTSMAALRQAIDALLDALARAAGRPGDPAPLFRLVTALAEGADSVAADAALARGWQLDAVLPFMREEYLRDFPGGEAILAHERRLAAAQAVLELPGSRAAPEGGAAAYERAGRLILAQSDILIAVWDGGPVLGRGGAAQIVAEAVLLNIPVIHLDPASLATPRLLWDGLEEHDLGQQTVETVARGPLDQLPRLVRGLLEPPSSGEERALLGRFERGLRRGWTLAIAYPLLLAIMGVRGLRRSDWSTPMAPELSLPAPGPALDATRSAGDFDLRLSARLYPRFARADAIATRVAQLFRSSYVTNFTFAALAVVLSLLGLVLPPGLKPLLIVAELSIIAVILILTRTGNRAAWHRRWLDTRQLAERLRCLAVSALLGDLNLRAGTGRHRDWVSWYSRATASELGLPAARVSPAYLDRARQALLSLLESQIAYLGAEGRRMHRLEHRLHTLGTLLFALTAALCVGFLLFAMISQVTPGAGLAQVRHPLALAVSIASAALPALGAAIYGIRMQGDFAGIAERAAALGHHLSVLRQVTRDDVCSFDSLRRRTARASALLTEDLENWLQTYHARPLNLPG